MAIEALGVLAEGLAMAANAVLEVTINAVRFAWTPLRFLCSANFRKLTRERWRDHPSCRTLDLVGGSAALIFFVAVFSGWIWFFTLARSAPAPPTTTPPPAKEAQPRSGKSLRGVIDKVRDFREKHRRPAE